MSKQDRAPIVRHSYAADPDPVKVQAALDLWRKALARKMALYHVPAPSEPEGAPPDSSGLPE
ncbi:MAG TPA: hypothetical protein VD969_01610 [Symbiobacteriaceae bacterium]|nr:hypothetical protein [Symbiobacteriaceae bacterium]